MVHAPTLAALKKHFDAIVDFARATPAPSPPPTPACDESESDDEDSELGPPDSDDGWD